MIKRIKYIWMKWFAKHNHFTCRHICILCCHNNECDNWYQFNKRKQIKYGSCKITNEEKKYIVNDTLAVKKALNDFYDKRCFIYADTDSIKQESEDIR